MIKKILLALAIALPACAFAQDKFAMVDAQTVMTAMPEYKDAQDKLGAASKTFEDQLTTLRSELDKKVQEFQALPETTSEAIRADKAKELDSMQQRIETFYTNAQQELQRQQQTLMQPIQEKLVNAIKDFGKEQGYLMIFPDGVAIYTSDAVVDVTANIKSKLGIQ